VAGHPYPHPHWTRTPPARPLRHPAPWDPPARLLQPLAPREPVAAPLPPSVAAPHWPWDLLLLWLAGPTLSHSRPQERPPVAIERSQCPANKNNDTIYQIKH
jgi:hypothetical protein